MLSLRRYVPAMLPDVLVLPMALVLSVALVGDLLRGLDRGTDEA